ncbi:MAG: ATP-binding protein [Pseudomonadota bacterium]
MNALLLLLVLSLAAALFTVVRLRRRLRTQKVDAQTAQLLERVKATAAERQRILNDLHDDIGAKLLTLVHTAENPGQADLAREVLQDLRDVVTRTRTGAASLLDVLAQIRDETTQRLLVMRAKPIWEQPDDLPDPMLDEVQTLNLFRIAREAVTNALRHAHARQVRIRIGCAGQDLLFEVTDDGPGMSSDSVGQGRGTAAMQNRAAELRGQIHWQPGTVAGTKVVLRFPLPAPLPPVQVRRE